MLFIFGTIIQDTYTKASADKLAFCIDDICSPKDSLGWASAGLYCFWNYYSRQILYIGLALDLSERFKQHNGIILTTHNSCKKDQIEAYFCENEIMGYSIFVQSPICQPMSHRNKVAYLRLANQFGFVEDLPYMDRGGADAIKILEGQLLQSYKMSIGVLPPWNKIGGSKEGQLQANSVDILQINSCLASDNYCNELMAKSTITELSNNPTFERYETNLHAARMIMRERQIGFSSAIRALSQFDEDYQKVIKEINDSLYFDKCPYFNCSSGS